MTSPRLAFLCALVLASCATNPPRQPVTTGARTSLTAATAASTAATAASQRSSAHIRAAHQDARDIDYKAQRAFDILDGKGHP